MRLDAALTSPNLDWLTTRSEKVAYLRARTAPESSEHPANATTQDTPDVANQFPGTFPIGIDPSGHVVLLYLATVPWTDDFRTFLVGHAALLRVTPTWTLRLVFPQPLRRAFAAYQTVVHEELESPLQADTIYDLKRYFFHRRRGTDLNAIPEALRAFLDRCAQVFGGPRFSPLQAVAGRGGRGADSALTSDSRGSRVGSRADRMRRPAPHLRHLSPLVSRRRSRRKRLQTGRERGRDAAQHQPVPQPGSLTRSCIHDGLVVATILRRTVAGTPSACNGCANAPRNRWGGVLCRP